MKQKKKSKGITLIEAIMSVALIAILIIPLSNVILGALQTNKDGELKQKATFVGQKVLEEMEAYDELRLEKDKSDDYFKLLDGDEITEDTANSYKGSFDRNNLGNNFRVELALERDSTFNYSSDSQNADDGYDILYKLSEITNNSNVIEKYISEGTEIKEFNNNNLTLKIDGTKMANVFEKGSTVKLLSDKQLVFPLSQGVAIELKPTFSSNINVDVDVDSTIKDTTFIYIIKDEGCTGDVNVTSLSGNIKVNRYINLSGEESIADLYNINVKVYKGIGSEVLFQGNTKKNIMFK